MTLYSYIVDWVLFYCVESVGENSQVLAFLCGNNLALQFNDIIFEFKLLSSIVLKNYTS